MEADYGGQYKEITVDGNTILYENYVGMLVGNQSFTGTDSNLLDSAEGSAYISFHNKVDESKLGSLQISKTLAGETAEHLFEFEVALDNVLLPVGTGYTVTDTEGTSRAAVVETAGSVKIKAGETASIPNILAGTFFKVQETAASSAGYNVTYTGGDGVTVSADGTYVTGRVPLDSEIEVHVNNEPRGAVLRIPVYKKLENPNGEAHTYTMQFIGVTDALGETQVTGPVQQQSITLTGSETTPPGCTFTLNYYDSEITGTQTKYFKITEVIGTEENTVYDTSEYIIEVTVTKNETTQVVSAEITKWWKKAPGGTEFVEITAPEEQNITFTNRLLYDLTLTKNVEGSVSQEKEYSFTVTIGSGEDAETETVTLKAGESHKITGLEAGTQWSILENDAESYRVSYTIGTDGEPTEGSAVSGTITGNTDVICLNQISFALPETGGVGSSSPIVLGLLLSIAAVYMTFKQKSKERDEGI